MPIGQVLTIPNGQSVLVTTLSREQKASIALLNPNDGVIYVKLNGPAQISPTVWDWKVPSQSYCQLPGPWQSIGVAYQDQSGAGGTATVNVYESDSDIAIPSFIAIGRALQSAGTTVDITQGTIPQNPPANTARLWVDSTGALHVLQSNGTDVTDLNTSNYNTLITMVGDVIGPLNNTTISMRNGSWATAHDASNNLVNFFTIWSDNSVYFQLPTNGGNFIFRQTNNTVAMTVSAGGILTIPNDLHSRYLHTSDGSNGIVYSDNGALYFRSSSGAYVFDSGGTATFSGQITSSSQINANTFNANGSNYYFNGNAGLSWYTDGTWLRATGFSGIGTSGSYVWMANNSAIGMYWDGTYVQVKPNIYTATGYFTGRLITASWDGGGTPAVNNCFGGNGGTSNYVTMKVYMGIGTMQGWADTQGNGNAVVAPNIGDNRGQMLAWQYATWSSVDHAEQYSQRIEEIIDPLGKVKAIKGVAYDHMSFGNSIPDENPDPKIHKIPQPMTKENGEFVVTPIYGFSAKDVYKTLPELVSVNPDSGDPEIIDLDRMLVVLWEAVKELEARVTNAGIA